MMLGVVPAQFGSRAGLRKRIGICRIDGSTQVPSCLRRHTRSCAHRVPIPGNSNAGLAVAGCARVRPWQTPTLFTSGRKFLPLSSLELINSGECRMPAKSSPNGGFGALLGPQIGFSCSLSPFFARSPATGIHRSLVRRHRVRGLGWRGASRCWQVNASEAA